MEELIPNIYEAVEGCLSVNIEPSSIGKNDKLIELATFSRKRIYKNFRAKGWILNRIHGSHFIL